MKKVYVAHPLRGDVEGNIKKVTEICQSLTNVIPLSPLHAFGFLDPTGDQFHAMQCCLSLLSTADELWVHGEWWKSEGCQAEMSFAGCRGIPIRFKGLEVPKYDGPITDR
jgi:hypothetical protein